MMATPTIDLEGAEHIVSDVQLGAAGAALKKRGHIVLVPQVGLPAHSSRPVLISTALPACRW